MNYKEIKRIHFIGIGGIGISYLAHFFLEQGTIVSGSDLQRSIVTDQLAQKGAAVFVGQSADQIPRDAEMVVYSDAIPEDNVELVRARSMSIPVVTNFEVVGELSKDYKTIVIAGNKGKTTTTAMLAHILDTAGCDPTAFVGSLVNDWKCNFLPGGSEYLVVEGDEFKEHFLLIDADIAVITNMAPDHMDYYKTEENLKKAFQTFVDKLPKDGLLVINADDEMTKELTMPECKVLKFSLGLHGDVNAESIAVLDNKQVFDVLYDGHALGQHALGFPGRFNVANALAAMTAALDLGISPGLIKGALDSFNGTWRRFQVLGDYKHTTVISDYAHHPTAVHATIEATKDFYEKRRVVAIFQPHTYHRTKALFDDFAASFDEADVVLLPDIYDVAGREVIDGDQISSEMLATAIRERGRVKDAQGSGDLATTKKMIEDLVKPDDVLLFMGAGDIYHLAESFLSSTKLTEFQDRFSDIIKKDESLKKYSTFKIGGTVDMLVEPKTSEQLAEVFTYLQSHHLHHFILGGGANILFPDEGIQGIILRPRNREIKIEGNRVYAEAGLPLAKLAQATAQAGLTGLEWCIAVPGTVGGAIRGNAGAFGGEVKDTLVSARITDGSEVKEYSNKQMNFRYRSSRIKDHKGSELVLDALFQLEPADAQESTKRVKEMLAKKFADQPMGELCAGCLFKNIELEPGKEVLAKSSKGTPTPKFFEDIKVEHADFIKNGKVPAGWIIEQLGFKAREPHAGIKVSEKHANFLVNTGEGSAKAVKELANTIKKEAKALYGIELEEEVQFVE
jgi:UDP-N-acetylmuramate--alanine ligase